MKLIKILITTILIGAGAWSSSSTQVLAQTVSPTVSIQKSNADQVNHLKSLFRQQLEQYQISQREYSLFKQQYKQLQTLASLEKAVQASREVLVKRSEVLTTYFDLLYAQVNIAPGIEPAQKQELIKEITSLVEQLRNQKLQAEAITDKQGVASFADNFEIIKPQIQSTSYKTRAFIQVGAYRDLLARAGNFSQEIKIAQASDSASAFKQTARQRAYQETDDQNQLVGQALDITLNKLNSAEAYSESWYQTVQEQLNQLQSGLEKLYAFIFELTNY